MLFLGDLGAAGGESLAKEADTYPISSDIVKIAHHGRQGSTPKTLLAEITPRYSVITCATSVAAERIKELLKVPGKFGRIYFTGSSDFTGDFCTLKIDGSGNIDFDNNFNYYWNDTK